MRAMIEAGAAGVHYEDQLAAEKKCGHLGGKVLVPTSAVRAHARRRRGSPPTSRGVPTVLVARTDSLSATLLTSDVDPIDQEFLTGRADARGLLPRPARPRPVDRALARLRAVRRRPLVRDLDAGHGRGARVRAGRSTSATPASCSPTTARRRSTGAATSTTTQIACFQERPGRAGLPLPVRHARRLPRAERSRCSSSRGATRPDGMPAYVALQEREFELEADGYTATRHQREVGAGYFDAVLEAITAARARRSRLRARPRRLSSSRDGDG